MTHTALTAERLAQIREALAAVPAPPWQWIGDRRTGAMLTTTHSGWLYLLGVEQPTDRDGEPAEDLDGTPIYAHLQFRHQADGAKYATLTSARELAVGRTDYDPDAIRDIDNPVARWMRDSAQYVAELLAEVEQLTKERDLAVAHAPGTGEPGFIIPPEVAAHVLWHFDATGSIEPGSFTQTLIRALDQADRQDLAEAKASWPAGAQAVYLARYVEGGIATLQAIARQALVPTGDGGEHRG